MYLAASSEEERAAFPEPGQGWRQEERMLTDDSDNIPASLSAPTYLSKASMAHNQWALQGRCGTVKVHMGDLETKAGQKRAKSRWRDGQGRTRSPETAGLSLSFL
jgi:hypothetical protein